MPEPSAHPTEPIPAGAPAPTAGTTPPSQRLRCPHCHNPIQLADGHSDDVLCPACGTAFQAGEARLTVSTAAMRPLGKFQLLERVGVGGFGAVWKARDTTLDRVVALKIPHSGLLSQATDLERFQREARAAAQLRHPGIVPVHEVLMLEGLPTIVSDFVTGVPLKDLLEARRLTPRESATLLAAAADAVHYAHTLGVVHRDLKPANVMVPYGPDPTGRPLPQLDRPLLMDFGLALRTDAEVTMTQEGHVLGTPAYMSPEQAAGRSHQADARSDVWALGVVLYEMLTGELPFRGSKVMMLMQVMGDEPKPPRRLDRTIPRDLETVCLKCLQKESSRRYASAAELAADLRHFLQGEPVLARRVGRAERLWRWCRRNPALAGLQAAVVVLLIVSTYFAIQADRRADEAEKSAERARTGEKEAQEVRDEAQLALARSWLGPLGLRDDEPLIDAEIIALWQVAENRGDRQWYRFLEEALRTPQTTHQLRNRAGPALHAAIGLDSQRRAAAEQLLLQRLQDPTLAEAHRVDVAFVAIAVGKPTPMFTAATATVLVQAMSKTSDAYILYQLAQGLSALAVRLEPKEAARVSAEAATVLAQAMRNTNDFIALYSLAQGLSALAVRLEPKEAARVSAEAATVLTKALSKTSDFITPQTLEPALSALAGRLEPKDAAATAAILAQAMTKDNNAITLPSLARVLTALAGRLEPKDAAATATVIAAQAVSKASDASILYQLAPVLTALAGRLEPKDAATTAAVLAQAMSTSTNSYALSQLTPVLTALAGQLEPKDAAATVTVIARAMTRTSDASTLHQLTLGLSALAARLEPKKAARVSAEAATVLAQAVSETDNANALPVLGQALSALAVRLEPQKAAATANVLAQALCRTSDANALYRLAQALSELASRLEPKEATRIGAEAATVLTQVISQTSDANTLPQLAQALSALAARLEPQEAARVSAEAVTVLAQVISQTSDANALPQLAQGLSALAARLQPKEAATTAAVLVQAMSKTGNAYILHQLAQVLSALAARLEPKEATRVSAEAAAVLTKALSKTSNYFSLFELAQGLSALAGLLEPKEAADAATVVTQAMSKTNHGQALDELAQALSALAARLEPQEAADAAAVLSRAMNKINLGALAQGLSAAFNGAEAPDRSRRAVALAGAVGTLAGTGQPLSSLAFLGPPAEPLPCRLSTQQLVDLLKEPTCLGSARRVVLDYLGYRYQRTFRDHWEFVEYAQQHLPDVDLTSPPKRPVAAPGAKLVEGRGRPAL